MHYLKEIFMIKQKMLLVSILTSVALLSGCATQHSLNKVAQHTTQAQNTADQALALATNNRQATQDAISNADAAQSTALQALSAAHKAQWQADRDSKEEQRMFKKSMMK
jgi:outer membrane murein-binding lipoprotein Lpp